LAKVIEKCRALKVKWQKTKGKNEKKAVQ